MAKTHLPLPSSTRAAPRRVPPAASVPHWTHTARTALAQLNTIASTALSTGLLIALLWLVGRYYAAGYFQAMRIPFFQLTFSVWDYVVWGVTTTWVAVMIGGVLMSGFIAYMTSIWSSYVDMATWSWWQRSGVCAFISSVLISSMWVFYGDLPTASVWIMLLFLNATILALPYWLAPARRLAPTALIIVIFASPLIAVPIITSWIGPMAFKSGWQDAQRFMQSETVQVRLISNEPTLVDTQLRTTLSVNGNDGYTYDGFYLLAYNDGRYFLYTSLTSECTPTQVYVVQEDRVQSVQYLPMQPLDCSTTMTVPLMPTPSPAPPSP